MSDTRGVVYRYLCPRHASAVNLETVSLARKTVDQQATMRSEGIVSLSYEQLHLAAMALKGTPCENMRSYRDVYRGGKTVQPCYGPTYACDIQHKSIEAEASGPPTHEIVYYCDFHADTRWEVGNPFYSGQKACPDCPKYEGEFPSFVLRPVHEWRKPL